MKIKLGFDESSKAVTFHVAVESEGEHSDECLAEARRLLIEGQKTSLHRTMQRT